MKIIVSLQGVVALHVSADDVRPARGAMTHDLIRVVGDTYAFAVLPQIPPGLPPNMMPGLIFQSGELQTDEGKIPITNLTIIGGGTLISCPDTNLAEQVLDHYIMIMEKELGYRVKEAVQRRAFQSSVIVDFNPAVEEMLSIFSEIETILTVAMPRPDYPFKFKRLAFGYGDPQNPLAIGNPSLDVIDNSDFIIERRAGEPYSRNRYFCSAPCRTDEHVRVLETVERVFLGKTRN